jgi:hypothetical protein
MQFVVMCSSGSGDGRIWFCFYELNAEDVTCVWMGQLLLLYSQYGM